MEEVVVGDEVCERVVVTEWAVGAGAAGGE